MGNIFIFLLGDLWIIYYYDMYISCSRCINCHIIFIIVFLNLLVFFFSNSYCANCSTLIWPVTTHTTPLFYPMIVCQHFSFSLFWLYTAAIEIFLFDVSHYFMIWSDWHSSLLFAHIYFQLRNTDRQQFTPPNVGFSAINNRKYNS